MNFSFTSPVCICVPTYNAEETLKESIESILSQTYENINVFIIDNASTDDTIEIANSYGKKDKRIKIFKHSNNVGGEGNFNRCIQLCVGDYMAIYHSDDVYDPNVVKEEVEFLEENKSAGAVFTMAIEIDKNGIKGKLYRLPYDLRKKGKKLYNFNEIFKAMLKYGNFFFCPSALVRIDIYKNYIKKWNYERYSSSADADVWLRILKKYQIGVIDKPLLEYRVGGSSFSYHAARSKTDPHIMFKMFDTYINDYAKNIVNENDRRNYKLLVLKDNINRAFNFLILGKKKEARDILKGVFIFSNIVHALKSFTNMKVILYGYIVYILLVFPINNTLKTALFKARFRGYK